MWKYWGVHRLCESGEWEFARIHVTQTALINDCGSKGAVLACIQDIHAVTLGKQANVLKKNQCSAPEADELYFSLHLGSGPDVHIRTSKVQDRNAIVLSLVEDFSTTEVVEAARKQIDSLGSGDTFIIRLQEEDRRQGRYKPSGRSGRFQPQRQGSGQPFVPMRERVEPEQIRQWQDDLQLAQEELVEAQEKEKLAQYQAAGKMKEYEFLKQKAERCKSRRDSLGRQANPSCGYGDGHWLGRNPTGRHRDCQSVTQLNDNDDRWMMGRYWLAFGL